MVRAAAAAAATIHQQKPFGQAGGVEMNVNNSDNNNSDDDDDFINDQRPSYIWCPLTPPNTQETRFPENAGFLRFFCLR